MQFVSGTHAISSVLFGILRPGDVMLSLTGQPYDTLEEVIGIRGGGKGSLKNFENTENECKSLLEKKLSLPAYDQCLKASHIFNLLDARGVIGVAERTGYITRIRELAKGCGALWLSSQN